MAKGRGLLLLGILLAGCAAPGTDVGTPTPTTTATTGPAPLPVLELPPCTLVPGEFMVPDAPGAPRPLKPVTDEGPLSFEVVVTEDGTSHIYADDAYSLFYANGYVQAKDRLFQMDLLRNIAWGGSAALAGPGQLPSDFRVVRDLYTYEEVKAQYDGAPFHARQVIDAFTDGVNRYIAEATSRPDRLPGEYVVLDVVPQTWVATDTVVIWDWAFANYGAAGGDEILNAQRLAELRQTLSPERATQAFDDLVWARAERTYPTIAPEDLVVNGCEDIMHAPAGSEQARLADLAAFAIEDAVPGDGDTVPPLLPDVPLGAPSGPGDRLPSPSPLSVHGGLGLMEGFQLGSAAVLVDGNHTATGRPMLIGGPQLGYHKPPVAYMIGLHGAGWDVAGIGIAGTPGVLWGRNPDFAWTVTAGRDDQADIVVVRTGVTAGDPDSFSWGGEAKRMECVSDYLHYTKPNLGNVLDEGQGQVGLTQFYPQRACRLEGMPVIARTAAEAPEPAAWAIRTTTRHLELQAAWMWMNVGRQGSLEEARAMLSSFPLSLNFHFADHSRIAFLHTGAVPLRAEGLDHRLPVPGGPDSDWQGIVYTSGLGMWQEGSSRGYLVNWNNAPALGWRSGDTPQKWGTVHRVDVLDAAVRRALAESGGKLSFLDLQAIEREAATRDSYADHFVPKLIEAARSHSGMGAMAEELEAWLEAGVPWRAAEVDGVEVYADPAHAIYDRAIAELVRRIGADELREMTPVLKLDPSEAGSKNAHAGDHGRSEAEYSLMYDAITGRARHDWCDDNSTRPHESCQEALVSALRLAQSTLTKDQTADTRTWRQPLHRSEFRVMGLHEPDSMPMVNRGTWVQVVAMGEGVAGAGVTLPPSNLGFVASHEITLNAAPGDFTEPPRLRQGLAPYIDFQFAPFPLTREEVEANALDMGSYTVNVFPVALPDTGLV